MRKTRPWYENDAFWATYLDDMFDEARWQAAVGQVASVVELLKLEPGCRVLDLCCGPGRHSLELTRRGFRVTGVDRTAVYLRELRQRARKERLNVEVVQQDMRRFVRPGAFDAAISMFTSFGYFEKPDDDLMVAAHVCRSLKKGGRFLIDVHGKETLARIYASRRWSERDGVVTLEEPVIEPGWGAVRNRWIMFKGGQRREFSFRLRLYAGTELAALLREAGFRKVELFGSLAGGPYDNTATRLVAVGMK